MTSSKVSTTPFFIDGQSGQLFAIYVLPEGAEADRAVLYLPPFAEEMNRSRRMAALFAQSAARSGIAVLILDPFGTGDSAGDFSEARWDIWRSDCDAALGWLTDRGHTRLHGLGLRTGANLLLEAAGESITPFESVILWQPVLRGDVFMNQFLRIRLAANLSPSSSQNDETAKSLLARLRGGETLEVAGYPLCPEIAEAIGQVRFVDAAIACPCPMVWIEIVADPSAGLAPATDAAVRVLKEKTGACDHRTIAGAPFWTIEEPVLVPQLLETTVDLLCPMPK